MSKWLVPNTPVSAIVAASGSVASPGALRSSCVVMPNVARSAGWLCHTPIRFHLMNTYFGLLSTKDQQRCIRNATKLATCPGMIGSLFTCSGFETATLKDCSLYNCNRSFLHKHNIPYAVIHHTIDHSEHTYGYIVPCVSVVRQAACAGAF